MAHGIKREPCFWMTTSENTGPTSPERSRSRMLKGRKVLEKLPQHGHVGDYENRARAPGKRYIMVVRHEGHTVPLLLTNAAAHLTPGPYTQYQLNKARALGWYPEGACPAALFVAGELNKDQVVSDEVRSATPCAQGTHSITAPCKHDLAERAARSEQWKRDHDERMAAFRDADEKNAERMREINKELVLDVANAVAEKVTTGKGKRGE